MSLVVKHTKKQYEIADEGTHDATLAEIRELGKVETGFGTKEKLLFIWELEDQFDSKGEPIRIFQRFNKSIHPKAALYKAVRSITGEDPGDEFDLEQLIGVSVQLVLQHNEGDDGIVYANVAAIVRLKTAEEEATVTDGIRKKRHPTPPIDEEAPWSPTDEEAPFKN